MKGDTEASLPPQGCAALSRDPAVPVPSWTHPGLAETNRLGLSNGAQVEAVCRRLDVMLTTRLHGMVLALKNGVPVIAIDPVAGGDKVTRQARLLGWNEVFEADLVTDEAVAAALERCLSEEGRARASLVKEAATRSLADFDAEFTAALKVPAQPELRADLVPAPGRVRALRKMFKAWKRRRRRMKAG
ncbi:polysaccharide pyruvyl transferase family protein [Paracoccus chinensis]|uniref:polysaccharide pyruvyl transferase family protein n=1 Tax=Paracoccus chinensis TaxID=525640 RepID=UPI00111437E2|nr:polysaccharide pyruvyl transferase family protein [Paracoccus chinensis]